ncbi:hypothetical protein BKA69DRAFT_1083831 [Paraphysoderma sedebokerense]|nr:hypothetical protein BKA69DRAFT_1083831 [Paraphysoderma sedebokerense]
MIALDSIIRSPTIRSSSLASIMTKVGKRKSATIKSAKSAAKPAKGQRPSKPRSKSKKPSKSVRENPSPEPEIDLEEEGDLKFLTSNDAYSSFLTNLDVKSLQKKETKHINAKKIRSAALKSSDFGPTEKDQSQSEVESDEADDSDGDEIHQELVVSSDDENRDSEIEEDSDEFDDAAASDDLEDQSSDEIESSDDGGCSEDSSEAELAEDTKSDNIKKRKRQPTIDMDAIPVDLIPEDLTTSSEDSDSESEAELNLKKRRRKVGEEEESYERIPRRFAKVEQSNALPIKTSDGRIVRVKKTEVDEDGAVNSDDGESDIDSEALETETHNEPEVDSDEDLTEEEFVVKKCNELAELAGKILEDPMKNVSLLPKLLPHLNAKTPNQLLSITILTNLQVYKDIIPGYHIKPLTEAQKKEKVSKDVRKLRDFEQGILHNFSEYLQSLQRIIKVTMKRQSPDRFSTASPPFSAVLALCTILESHPDFNFNNNTIELLTSFISQYHEYPLIRNQITETFYRIFQADEQSKVSLEIVKCLSEWGRKTNWRWFDDKVLGCLKSVKVNAANMRKDKSDEKGGKENAKGKQGKKHVSKKMKKQLKLQAEVEKELKEAEAAVDRQMMQKLQTQILTRLFHIYFHLLKLPAHQQHHLPSVLELLQLHIHLISIDFFQSLFTLLQSLITTRPNVSDLDKLRIVKSLVQIRVADGIIDFKDCGVVVWNIMNRLLESYYSPISHFAGALEYSNTQQSSAGTGEAMLEGNDPEIIYALLDCLSDLYLRHRTNSATRVASFVKQLCSLANSAMETHVVLATLSLIRELVSSYPSLRTLFTPLTDRPTSGLYNPSSTDPDLTNPWCTTTFELYCLFSHWNPMVRGYSQWLVTTLSAEIEGEAESLTTPLTVTGYKDIAVDVQKLVKIGWRDVWKVYSWVGGSKFKPGIKQHIVNGKPNRGSKKINVKD